MRILYLSCHSILEYDELKIIEELGIEYFSLGSYLDPQKPVDDIRPALGQARIEEFYSNAPDRNNIPKEFFDKFDTIIVMHVPEWIEKNWEKMKHKRVIWRTIGQSTTAVEKRLEPFRAEGLEVLRYSPREANIEGNIGADAVIRFYKDPEEFKDYTGVEKVAINFTQNMKNRAEFCSYDAFMDVASKVEKVRVYGPNNENLGKMNGGFLTYQEMRQAMRDARVYIYTGTQPASYTLNFIEAMMTGIPVVAFGDKFANSMRIAGDTYEIPDIIQNGFSGYFSDDKETIIKCINHLLNNPKLAKRIGAVGRARAIELFGKEKIKEEWKTYLKV
jgi:hypothetical protein